MESVLSMVNNLDYDLCRASWVAIIMTHDISESIYSHSGNNRTGGAFQEYDTLLSRSDQELDIEKRALILKEAEIL
jgi:ABC-type oligopeptide transport system substrate-binding subunit